MEFLVLGKSKLTKTHPESGERVWSAFPKSVDRDGNLVVLLQPESGVAWEEEWNLAHTLAGIQRGFYRHEIQD